MSVAIKISAPLRRFTDGKAELYLEVTSIAECLDKMEEQFPGIKLQLCDEQGLRRPSMNIYVNGDDTRFLQELNTPLKDGDNVSIVPALAGG